MGLLMSLEQIHSSSSITMNTFSHLERKWNDSKNLRPLVLLAGLVASIAIPILLMADAGRYIYRTHIKNIPSADYHYFFSSELYTRYAEQLKNYISDELKDHPAHAHLPLIRLIQNSTKNDYQAIVQEVRKLVIQKSHLDPETARFVERLCCWIYTGPDLLPTMTDWMKNQISTDLSRESIRDLHKRLGQESRFQGEIFQDYRPYDPRYLGDTPSHFFSIQDTQIIRTPAITKDAQRSCFGNLTRAAIVEEFQGFLDHYQREGKTHLYVNLMAPHGSEKIRTEAIEELERKSSAVFHLLTLSKDCAFYHQVDSFWGNDDASQFKETFMDQMFHSNPAFHWPISWDSASTQTLVRKIIDEVHEKHYQSAPQLNRDQRCDFIELAYTAIIESLLHEKKPATCNVSCRSCVDRGAANLALLYAKTQPLETAGSKETLATIALAPAMISQSRQMLPHRMHRLAPALNRLLYI